MSMAKKLMAAELDDRSSVGKMRTSASVRLLPTINRRPSLQHTEPKERAPLLVCLEKSEAGALAFKQDASGAAECGMGRESARMDARVWFPRQGASLQRTGVVVRDMRACASVRPYASRLSR